MIKMIFDFDQYVEAEKLSSMDYWHPLTKDLPIPQPRTEVVKTMGTDKWIKFLQDPTTFDTTFKEILFTAAKIGYPLFMRTDQSSAKHSYVDTCKVESRERLSRNLYMLIEENIMCDINVQTLYFRKFIELNSTFKAFNKMPIAPERRYFVKDGEVLCRHPYWPEDAIRNPDREDWKGRLRGVNFQEGCEIYTLKGYATLISETVPGCWSVDFAQAKNGVWHFIDMADARRSWHPEDCKNFKKLSLEDPAPAKPCNVKPILKIDETDVISPSSHNKGDDTQ